MPNFENNNIELNINLSGNHSESDTSGDSNLCDYSDNFQSSDHNIKVKKRSPGRPRIHTVEESKRLDKQHKNNYNKFRYNTDPEYRERKKQQRRNSYEKYKKI